MSAPGSGHALLIVGHGTRDDAGREQSRRLLAAVRDLRPGLRAELGFLELCPPPVAEVAADLADAGTGEVVVAPLVLLAASHAKGHVPAAVERARRAHPAVRFRYARPLGVHPEVIALLDDRLRAAVPEEERPVTAVALIGRGATDPDANGDVAKVARLLWEGREWPLVEPGFVSLAEPAVPGVLDRCRALGAERIAVLPYFLFTGVLVRRVHDQARSWARRHPGVEVTTAAPLGPDERIARLVLDRHDQARAGRARANCDTCQYRVALPGHEARVGAAQRLHHHPDDPGTHDHATRAHDSQGDGRSAP